MGGSITGSIYICSNSLPVQCSSVCVCLCTLSIQKDLQFRLKNDFPLTAPCMFYFPSFGFVMMGGDTMGDHLSIRNHYKHFIMDNVITFCVFMHRDWFFFRSLTFPLFVGTELKHFASCFAKALMDFYYHVRLWSLLCDGGCLILKASSGKEIDLNDTVPHPHSPRNVFSHTRISA